MPIINDMLLLGFAVIYIILLVVKFRLMSRFEKTFDKMMERLNEVDEIKD